MIIVEYIASENRERRYSDNGVKILQIETGRIYDNVVDYIPCEYTYEETDIPAEENHLSPQEALDLIFGGAQ